MTGADRQQELQRAAWAVATAVSVGAYRKGRGTHAVSDRQLQRLLDALAAMPLGDVARAEVEARLAACDKAEADMDAYRAQRAAAS